jgi:hypothetical protein
VKRIAVVAIGVALFSAPLVGCDGSGDRPLSASELQASSDDALPLLVFEHLDGPEDASIARRTIWLTEYTNFEVGNGGFVQYFFNTDGEYVDDTVAALERIGAAEHASVLLLASDRWRQEQEVFRSARADGGMAAFARLYEQSSLSELGDRWYDVQLEPLEGAWIGAHAEDFAG